MKAIPAFSDYLALAYHVRQRNVWHIVKAGRLDRSRYRSLIGPAPGYRHLIHFSINVLTFSVPMRDRASSKKL
jgi:hypothetical protein